MKKSSVKILAMEAIIFLLFIPILFFKIFQIFGIREYSYFFVLLISYILSIFILGKSKNKNSNTKTVFWATIIFCLLYQVFTFVFFGLFTGFLSSAYKLGFTHLFKIVLPLLLIIVISEILRDEFIEKGRNSKLVLIFTTLLFIGVDVMVGINLYSLGTAKGIFEFFAFLIFPSIMKNILLTYMVYHYSYKPNIIYRLLMEIPIYYLPIVPNINDFLQSVLSIIFPFLFLLYMLTFTESTQLIQQKKNEEKKLSTLNKVFSVIIAIILFIFICLMSGLFKYFFLAVGSGSMSPNINTGDLAFVEKIDDAKELKVGDVLVYNKDKKVILHRIVEIDDTSGSKLIFTTKGDNNDAIDAWDIYESDVIGVVKFKIKWVGYPTVWLNELFEGGK